MRIAVSATGSSLDAPLDERFGRCPCFVLVDEDGPIYEMIDNPHADGGSGVGIQAARLLADRGVSVVLTGRCGPNASETLAAADIEVVTGCSGTVRQALEKYRVNPLGSAAAASAGSASTHMDGGAALSDADPAPDAFAPGRGRGMGRRMGRGMGGGQGRGRGRGMGRRR